MFGIPKPTGSFSDKFGNINRDWYLFLVNLNNSVGNILTKGNDQSVTNSTVLVNDNDLFLPIAPNEEWTAQISLDAGSALSTTGIKLAVTVPSGASLNVKTAVIPDSLSTTGTYVRRTTSSGAAMDFTTVNQPSTAESQILMMLWVSNSVNAGKVNLQFAQSTSSGTAVTLRKGSYLRAFRVS